MVGAATVTLQRDRAVKRYRVTGRLTPARAVEHEVSFYLTYPWACPALLDYDHTGLVTARWPTAEERPGERPAAELRALLARLHAEGVHHRDVMVRNVLITADGPRLIDWEHAIAWPAPASYDLAGPEASGVPVPSRHRKTGARWWGSPRARSLASNGMVHQ